MHNMRRRHDAAFKARVGLEAMKEEKTTAQIASEYGVHPNQIRQWKKQILESLPAVFSDRRPRKEKQHEELVEELYRQIGQLKVELDWLKKNLNCSVEGKRMLIEPDHPVISISRQCDLLGLSRSSYYYEGSSDENSFNLEIMRLMDEQYTRTPFYGVPRMTAFLRRKDYEVNPKRIRRLMRLMGIEAIYPRRRLSKPCPEHTVYPYLLKGLDIDRPDLVWCSDIMYIRLFHGFVYLVAIMDWFSRYVLAWALSTTLDASFCVHALKMALALGKPAIFNTDQGSRFTSGDFTTPLKEAGIRNSMDGRGRVFDNIFIERLWRSVK